MKSKLRSGSQTWKMFLSIYYSEMLIQKLKILKEIKNIWFSFKTSKFLGVNNFLVLHETKKLQTRR